MPQKQSIFTISEFAELHTDGAGYDILRHLCLPELLGDESSSILYFMGRNLARKIDINSMEEIVSAFDVFGWGKLELVKEKRKELVFQLMSDAVVRRLESPFDTEFRLEAGFLAEAVQTMKQTDCECTETTNRRIGQIEFSVIYTD
nr:YslB family protein [Lentibacillus sediminis]